MTNKLLRNASSQLWRCGTCPCPGTGTTRPTVTCVTNPDAPVPAVMHLRGTFCGVTYNFDSSSATLYPEWVYTGTGPDISTMIAGDHTLGVGINTIQLYCCGFPYPAGTWAAYANVNFWKAGVVYFGTSPYFNYSATPCDGSGGNPVNHTSFTINATNPVHLTMSWRPRDEFLAASGDTAFWALIKTLLGCAIDDPTWTQEFY